MPDNQPVKWGKPGWNKNSPKGKLVIHNATTDWNHYPGGMDVKVKIEGVLNDSTGSIFSSPEETIAPGKAYGYEPPKNTNNIKIIARSKVPGMKSLTHKIADPLSQEDQKINIMVSKTAMSLLARRV